MAARRSRRDTRARFAALPRVLQLPQVPPTFGCKRETEVGIYLQIRTTTKAIENVELLKREYAYLFQPYQTEVEREATTREARALGNPTVTRPRHEQTVIGRALPHGD